MHFFFAIWLRVVALVEVALQPAVLGAGRAVRGVAVAQGRAILATVAVVTLTLARVHVAFVAAAVVLGRTLRICWTPCPGT